MNNEPNRGTDSKKGKLLSDIIVIGLLFLSIFGLTGFFVQQPIGAVPEGVTIWYFRVGTDMPFISSADGMSLSKTGSVSLLSRTLMIKEAMDKIGQKRIANLPYIDFMYGLSTNGARFDR